MNRDYARRILARRVAEQDGLCCYCRRSFTPAGPLRATLEHCKAKMYGGRDRVSNLAAACFQCNQHRGVQMNRARQRAQTKATVEKGKVGAGSRPA